MLGSVERAGDYTSVRLELLPPVRVVVGDPDFASFGAPISPVTNPLNPDLLPINCLQRVEVCR